MSPLRYFLLFFVIHGTLAWFNRRVARSWLYPLAIFAGYWTVLLSIAALSGDLLYPISDETQLLYAVGDILFSLGGFVAVMLGRPSDLRHRAWGRRYREYMLNGLLVIVLLGVPLYLRSILSLANPTESFNLARSIRYETSTNPDVPAILGLLRYLRLLSLFVAYAAMAVANESRFAKLRALFALLLAIVYPLMIFDRTGVIYALAGCAGILMLTTRRVRMIYVALAAVLLVIIFVVTGVILEKGGSLTATPQENLDSSFNMVIIYVAGGPVAFDNVVSNPDEWSSWGQTTFLIRSVLYKLGLGDAPRGLILPAVNAPGPINIFTFYFSYYNEFGWLGILCGAGMVGFLTTRIYLVARKGFYLAIVLYGLTVASIILSNTTDGFALGAQLWIEATVIALLVFAWDRSRPLRGVSHVEASHPTQVN